MLGKFQFLVACVAITACGSNPGTTQPVAAAAGSGTSNAGQTAPATTTNGSTSSSQAGTKAPISSSPAGQVALPPAKNQAGAAAEPASGAAGAPAAGAAAAPPAGDGSVAIAHPDPKPSPGCGMPAPMAGNASIDIMGTSRDYILALPQGYDSSKPYKLIFAWHGLGGSAQQVASNWYGLARMAQDSAIFVAGQGLMTMTSVGDGAGWPNTNGQDVAFVKALYAQLQNQLCLDENRVFSTGMSYGGIMSNTLGCQMGDVIRAIAPMSGSGPGFGGRGGMCVGQVAVWMSHGDNDTVVPTSAGDMSRDYWVNANHCQMQNAPVDPSPCVEYAGCDADSPVTFCKFMGGHTVPPFASAAIWKFFSQF